MALIKSLTKIHKARQAVHQEVECNYSILTDESGVKYLQLDTYGSPDRQMPGKTSQSIQFSRDAAEQLKRIIAEVFR